MDVGTLRHRISIMEPTIVLNELREPVSTTTTPVWENVPANVEPITGDEGFFAAQTMATTTHVVSFRYLPGVKNTQRVVFGTRTFEVTRVINVEERNRELRLWCTEIVS